MAIEGYARQSRDLMAYERERRKEDMVKYK